MTDDEVDIEIPLRIESDNDLYNKLDPTRSTIDDSVYDYMFEKMSDIRRGERVRVNVFSAQKLDEERVRKAFMDNLDDHLAKLHRERMTNRMNQARLFIIGIAFINDFRTYCTFRSRFGQQFWISKVLLYRSEPNRMICGQILLL